MNQINQMNRINQGSRINPGSRMNQVRIRKKDMIFYAISIVLCAASYVMVHANIELSLFPHKIAMEYLFGFHFVFTDNVGYEQINGLFIITRNCLGVNLFISLFLIMTFGFLHKYTGIKHKITALLVFYGVSGVLALALTLLRISASVPFCTWDQFYLIHNIISLIIYFLSGLGLYGIMEKLTQKVFPNVRKVVVS